MGTGTKIKKLRESNKMSQQELALQLGISQTTLHNIESGNHQKIDYKLMDKICNIFDKDFSYFANDSVINNRFKDNTGQFSCGDLTINNNCPETILTDIQNLIEENKILKAKIAAMEGK